MKAKSKIQTHDSSSESASDNSLDLHGLISSLALSDNLDESKPDFSREGNNSRIAQVINPGVSALDVAEYILRKCGRMSTMKLQKLVYYAQAWSLVWDEAPLFQENVEAWANGPVIRELFNYHRGMFDIDHVRTGNPGLLSASQKETVDVVLDFYGNKPAQWLIDLSHSEEPWQKARKGLPETARGSRIIPLDLMANYYSSL